MDSIFDPAAQHDDVDSKIAAALERLYTVFRASLWRENKRHRLSPLQLQVLVFLLFHDRPLCRISSLAGEYGVTVATVSDTVAALEKKGLLTRDPEPADRRISYLVLTPKGRRVARATSFFASDIKREVGHIAAGDRITVMKALMQVIEGLQRQGIVTEARMCITCAHFEKRPEGNFCRLLGKPLADRDLRMDCPEHSAQVA